MTVVMQEFYVILSENKGITTKQGVNCEYEANKVNI